jgi:hypothetical protein
MINNQGLSNRTHASFTTYRMIVADSRSCIARLFRIYAGMANLVNDGVGQHPALADHQFWPSSLEQPIQNIMMAFRSHLQSNATIVTSADIVLTHRALYHHLHSPIHVLSCRSSLAHGHVPMHIFGSLHRLTRRQRWRNAKASRVALRGILLE